jgi:hypothetical protein
MALVVRIQDVELTVYDCDALAKRSAKVAYCLESRKQDRIMNGSRRIR